MNSAVSKKRVYKFLSADFALKDLRERRIKVSTFPDMNDPFELTGGISCKPELREHLATLISRLNEWCGVLCFSQDWRSPMLWSHYAAKHAGICVGFDVSTVVEMKCPCYVASRQEVDTGLRVLLDAAARVHELRPADVEACMKVVESMLLTKFAAWRYEDEVRLFVVLKQEQKLGDLYFAELDDHIQPSTVILGARCTATEEDIKSAISKYSPPITVVRTMLSSNSFQVVEQAIAPYGRQST
jgi:hypothetical protein